MKRISVPVWKCQKCLHEWVSRKKNGKPAECPNCKRRDWNKRNLAGSKRVTVKVPPLYRRN